MRLLLVTPLQIALILGSGALAGGINSVAGGGSFLTFPALLFSGLPSLDANVTSTIAVWPGSLASVGAYRGELAAHRRTASVLGAVSAVGGLLGAILLLKTPEVTFDRLVPWLLLFATLMFTFGKGLMHRFNLRLVGPGGLEDSWRPLVKAAVVQFPIAVYGGFYGAGAGVLQLAILDMLGLDNIHTANAVKVIMSAAFNATAVALFLFSGKVWWGYSLLMMGATIFGGYGGAWLAQRMRPDTVRWFVIAIGVSMTIYFFSRGR